jgi:LPS-assembly protein
VAEAAEGPVERRFLLLADELRYDENTATVMARGKVEISTDDRVLTADRISYFQRVDTVVAEGNVSLLEPDGTVLFAERMELRDELRNGLIDQLRGRLADNARVTAAAAVRDDGNRTRMLKALYSPCELCPERPERAPVWAVRAARVVHDQNAKQVEYSHARIELYGVPIVYTPYLSHPDPTVDRRSGFLAPSFGRSSKLGTKVETPYFFNLAPNADLTLNPLYTSKEGPVIGGEYRQRTRSGLFDLAGSFTRPDRRDERNRKTGKLDDRGHVRGQGRFDLDPTWRWGFQAARASDDTYLKKYGFGGDDILRSRLYVEGLRGRSYAAASTYAFQGLRTTDDPGQTPYALPLIDYNYISDTGRLGDTIRFDASFLSLSRNSGSDVTRLAMRTGWQIPFHGALGDLTTLRADLRTDGYYVSDAGLTNVTDGATDDGFVGRAIPQVAVDWRLPLVRREAASHQVLTPIANLIVSPYGGNPGRIPNEDSRNFEFDDTNLFTSNRFPGFDRVEGGPRANLGVKYGIYSFEGYSVTAFLGQTFRNHADDTFAQKSGLEGFRSDYVSRIDLSPSPYLLFYERFRFDKDTLGLRRHEIGTEAGPREYRVSLTYVQLSRELTTDALAPREEINVAARARVSEFWTARGATRHDLTSQGGAIKSAVGLFYEDECLDLGLNFVRDYTRDRDVEPSTSVSVRVRLKTLG